MRRGRRHAEDEIEALGSTPVENLWTTIVTVGAQQAAQEGANLIAAGPLGGTKNPWQPPPVTRGSGVMENRG